MLQGPGLTRKASEGNLTEWNPIRSFHPTDGCSSLTDGVVLNAHSLNLIQMRHLSSDMHPLPQGGLSEHVQVACVWLIANAENCVFECDEYLFE